MCDNPFDALSSPAGRWLAHLYVVCKGGNSWRRRQGFYLCLTSLIDLHAHPLRRDLVDPAK